MQSIQLLHALHRSWSQNTVEQSKVLAIHRCGMPKGRIASEDVRPVSDCCCDTQGGTTPSLTTASFCSIETTRLVGKDNGLKALEDLLGTEKSLS